MAEQQAKSKRKSIAEELGVKATVTKEAVKPHPHSPTPVIVNTLHVLQEHLDAIDYNNIEGDNYEKYMDLVYGVRINPENLSKEHEFERMDGIPSNAMCDFLKVKAYQIFKPLYPGMKGSPNRMTGIGITNLNSPDVIKVRMELRHAKDLNLQIQNSSMVSPVTYYIIKK